MSKILIVDDDTNTTWLMDQVLSKAGFEIHSINNSPLAVSEALNIKSDLILVDLRMPDLDGIKLCQELHENPDTQNMPVLVLSAFGDVDSKVEAFKAGAKDFITKPVHVEELKCRIRAWLNHHG